MPAHRRACDSCCRKKILCDGDGGECDWCRHHGLRCTYERPLKKRMASAAGYASTSSFKKRIERLEVALHEAQSKLGDIGDSRDGLGPSPTSSADAPPRQHSSTASAWSFSNSTQIFNLGRFHLAGHHIGAISSSSCLPVFSPVGQQWVYAATGQMPSFDKLRAYEAKWSSVEGASAGSRTSMDAAAHFPSREMVETLSRTYVSSPVYAVFPVIDPYQFQAMIKQTYDHDPNAPRPGTEIARAAVLAFTALAVLMTGSVDMPFVPGTEDVDTEALALRASDYLPYLLQEPGVSQCSTLLTLAIFHVMSGHEFQGAMILSLACRSLLVLNAHTLHPTIPLTAEHNNEDAQQQTSRRHLRQLFWLAHSMDKEMSLRSGLGPAFSDEFCDLTPPQVPGSVPPPQLLGSDMDGQPQHHHNKLDARFMPPALVMSLMKSRICRVLDSEAALHKTSFETLRDIRLLDEELEQWRMSMPAEWRPTLNPGSSTPGSYSGSATSSSAASPGDGVEVSEGNPEAAKAARPLQSPHAVMVKLAYYHLLSVVHRASGRCRAMTPQQQQHHTNNNSNGTEELANLGEGISSSLAISVQASRMTICCIRDLWESTSSYSFWVIVFYPISAVLAIFCHILLDPTGPAVQEDLVLIGSVPRIVRNLGMRRRQHQVRNEAFYGTVDELCAELVRLGECAVYKTVERQMCELMS
ncbi:proline utilization trans-activator [Microdochium nivale]|nr:proline utilization trans-activator [Microdochium nivale]